MRRVVLVVAVLLAALLCANAENPAKRKLIAVNVVSTSARLQSNQPQLGAAAADVIKHFQNVEPLVISGTRKEAEDKARKQGADFLILIEVSPRSNVRAEVGAPPRDPAPERGEEQWTVSLKYSVLALKGDFKWADDTLVSPVTYPQGEEWDRLPAIASQSVRDATNTSMRRLKKKQQI